MYQGVHNVAATPDIPRRLPRGTHGLDPSLVAASQRTRLLEAAGRAVAEKGYAAATIEDIVRGAGVSKKTFYEHFADKLDCFLAAYEAASDELFEHVRAAQETAGDWVERTRAGIHAYLRWLAAEPALARVFLIEIAAAGPGGARAPRAAARPLRGAHARAPGGERRPRRDLPRGGGRRGRPRRAAPARGQDVRELEPILLQLQVALLAGPKAAAELD